VADQSRRFNPPHPRLLGPGSSRVVARPPQASGHRGVAALLDSPDTSLVDVVDSLLDKGVVLDGELVLGLADVDLIYLRLSVLLVAADRVLPART
jgi:hypothetical protein